MNSKLPGVVILLLFWLNASPAFSQKQPGSAPATPMRPNIILIMSDDQGWGDVSYNGHPYLKTPNLDQMTRDGARFTRAYSGSAVCSPTRASFLTGRNPERMGICFANCGHLKKEEITLL